MQVGQTQFLYQGPDAQTQSILSDYLCLGFQHWSCIVCLELRFPMSIQCLCHS